MLYFAYGSNLNVDQMKERCPAAVPICKLALRDSRLVFRGVADCIYEPGSFCQGGIWRITKECERVLDRYEGVSSGMYRKDYIDLEVPYEGETEILYYVMNSTGIMPPSRHYLETIKQGYRDFKLPLSPLRDAVRASWDDKHPSHVERKRHRRTGRPKLAARPEERVTGTVKNAGKDRS